MPKKRFGRRDGTRRRAWWRGTLAIAGGVCCTIFGAGNGWAALSIHQTSDKCDQAARDAAQATGVPLDVLLAISRTETGRAGVDGLIPWPWTVNMEGAGRWFDTEDDARAYVFRHFKRGARSFDVGCFQINYKWHGAAFKSIDEMFDPLLNARYAARFLGELYDEFGDWGAAAGAFHSRTPEFATPYAAKFQEIRTALVVDAPKPASQALSRPSQKGLSLAARPGARALMPNATSRHPGSLVPAGPATPTASQAFIILD